MMRAAGRLAHLHKKMSRPLGRPCSLKPGAWSLKPAFFRAASKRKDGVPLPLGGPGAIHQRCLKKEKGLQPLRRGRHGRGLFHGFLTHAIVWSAGKAPGRSAVARSARPHQKIHRTVAGQGSLLRIASIARSSGTPGGSGPRLSSHYRPLTSAAQHATPVHRRIVAKRVVPSQNPITCPFPNCPGD